MGVESAQAAPAAAASAAKQAQDLIDAARYVDLEDVVALFSAGVSLDSTDSEGRTALHMAAANGHLAVVEYLIRNGAGVRDETTKAEESMQRMARDPGTRHPYYYGDTACAFLQRCAM